MLRGFWNFCKNGTNKFYCKMLGVSQFVGLLRQNHLYGLILHGFFARIFARIDARIFARILLRGVIAWIISWIFARTFCTGVPKHLLRSAKNPPRKSPRKFGPSGAGLGRQEGEVATLANPTKPSLGLRGLGGGAPVEEVGSSHSSGLEPRF